VKESNMAYTFYEDPGHGWLEVPMIELREMRIDHMISPCSYRDGGKAYLEEDCDLSIFLAAKLKDGPPPSDWKAACASLHNITPEIRKFFDEHVATNDRATLWGAPEIWIRRLPNYYP
jgi:hypothetical protein